MSSSVSSLGPGASCVDADQVYRHSQRVLRPALTGRLGNQADADDVLHEAFARYLDRYAGRSILNPLGLLARIALNVIRDDARMRRGRADLLDGVALDLHAAPLDPEMEASGRQDFHRVCAAIDTLPPRCRQVFLLCRVEGVGQAEAARLLGISKSGVEKQLIRAQTHLRHALERSIDRPDPAKA